MLCTDVIVHMMDYLSDIDKINFLKTCSSFYNHRFCVKFHDFHLYDKICNLDFKKNFKRIVYTKIKSNTKFFILKNSYDRIPMDIKHLIIGDLFKISLENIIPKGITHLTIEKKYNVKINPGEIPDTVTYLNIKSDFCIIEKDAIPNSVTHLYINGSYDGPSLKDIIPKNVTHLQFGICVQGELGEQIIETQEIDGKIITTTRTLLYIPNSVVHLHLDTYMQKKFGKQIVETQKINGDTITTTRILSYIPNTVINLTLYGDIRKNIFDFIPKNLVTLKLYGNIKELIDETIVPKITTLGLLNYKDSNMIHFPKTLNNLKFLTLHTNSKIYKFGHIIYVSRRDYFGAQYIPHDNVTHSESLKHHLNNVFLKNLPCNIKTLTINEKYDKNIVKNVPNTVNILIFNANDLINC